MYLKHEPAHVHGAPTKTGVLLVNLGTPSATDYLSMRRYLKEFLSDRRVVEMSPLFWRTLLNGILLQIIPQKSARNYRKIWNTKQNESPLLTLTRAQATALQAELGRDFVVDFAMRYGNPAIEGTLDSLKERGCDRIVVLPLYPQYSSVTTGSVYDALFDGLKKARHIPYLHLVRNYHDHPLYIDALAQSVATATRDLPHQPDMVLLSYHGIPVSYFKSGDPYPCHCWKTSRLLREKMGWAADAVRTTFQSKFGKAEWLTPATDATLAALPAEGYKNVLVLTPGFAADCVETLEEINQAGRETFIHAGGETFTFVPCLNDTPSAIALYAALVKSF
ncbi:MAG: ferrochelatase [Proteobacteria bacterium]|nr:ferrochelatase [Pseudomonadota bacterium]